MKKCTYVQNKNIIFRQEEDEAIIFNSDNLDVMLINSVGCLIWSLCDGKNTKEIILKKIVDEFEVTSEETRKDLDRFLLELKNKNLIKKTE